MNTSVMFSSKSDEWETPIDVFNRLNEEFDFDLEPCADENNHKCDRYFTKKQNGLIQNWGGGSKVFCNPPYGKEISAWVRKCSDESKKENTVVVMLIPARTDTKWFHDYIYQKAEVRFLKGRLKFGGSKNNAPFPSMVVVFK